MMNSKSQILSSISNNNCCSHTFVNALIFSASQINKEKSLIMISSLPEILSKAEKIISNFYPKIEINSWDNFLLIKGNIVEMLNDLNYSNPIDLNLFPDECDRCTILKTLFLTSGRFYYNQDNSKNSKGYVLEFVFKDESLAQMVLDVLKEFGFELKKIKRLSYFVVYSKNSNTICDLLVKLGATYSALEVQNSLAMREMRNAVNRQNNCFESNLDKTISASAEQLKAINYVINNYSIDYLDENLREVALARLVNPDVSLNELKIVLNNKLSRAGIKYRLDKIIDIYKKLKGENQ